MASTSDLREQRQATEDLIASSPTNITLVRETVIEEYGGSRVGPPTPQAPRERFLTPLRRLSNVPEGVNDLIGEGWQLTHLVVGPHDDDIQQDDQFTHDNVTYRIVDVERRGEYEVRALCVTKQITHN